MPGKGAAGFNRVVLLYAVIFKNMRNLAQETVNDTHLLGCKELLGRFVASILELLAHIWVLINPAHQGVRMDTIFAGKFGFGF